MDPYTCLEQSENTPEPSTLHTVVRFLGVVNRHRMILISMVAAAACLSVVYYKQVPRQYESSASLMIRQLATDPKLESSLAAHGLLSSYSQLLLSDLVLINTVEHLKVRPPELTGISERSLWPNELRDMLTVSFEPDENILDITCRSRNSEVTVDVIRALISSSSRFMEDYQKNMSLDLVERLDKERVQLENRLFAKEKELLRARKECGDITVAEGSDDSHPVVQRVAKLNDELTTIRRNRLELEALLHSVQSLVQSGGDLSQALQKLESIVGEKALARVPGSGVANGETLQKLQNELSQMETELAALRRHYGSRHAEIIRREAMVQMKQGQLLAVHQDMQRQVGFGLRDAQVGQWMVQTVASELNNTRQYEAALQREYNAAEQQALALSDKLADIHVAEREVEMLRQLHTSHLNRLSSIEIVGGHGAFRVAALTEPLLPDKSVFPVLSTVLFVFCSLAFLISLAVIYVIDLLDDRLRSPEEVRSQLNLPLLGIVRRLPDAEKDNSTVYIHRYPQTPQAECFRTLRTSLVLADSETSCIAVTSTEAGEGKTTLTVNLAAAFAQTGKRTLLIDADMRRPGLSKLLEVRARPGLSEVLRAESGIADLCDAKLIPTEVPLLDVLPCGPRISNAGLLLSMPSLADVLDWASSKYDQVIVDCPPTLPVSDAAIVGRYVDGMLFLLNPDKTPRRGVLRAVAQLRSMGMTMLGVVANASQAEDKSGYGYGGYGYGYGHGGQDAYTDDDEFESLSMLDAEDEEPVVTAFSDDSERKAA